MKMILLIIADKLFEKLLSFGSYHILRLFNNIDIKIIEPTFDFFCFVASSYNG